MTRADIFSALLTADAHTNTVYRFSVCIPIFIAACSHTRIEKHKGFVLSVLLEKLVRHLRVRALGEA